LVGSLLFVLASSCNTATTQPATKTALDAVVGAIANLQHSRNTTVGWSITKSTALGGAATGTGWHDFVKAQGSLTLKLSNQSAEPVLFAPTAIYVQPPGRGTSTLPAGSWVLVDLLEPSTNFSPTAVGYMIMNPGFAAYLLTNAAISASVVSDSSPAFPGATHYVVTVNPGRIAPSSPPASAAGTATPAAATPQVAFANAAAAVSNTISSANGGSLVTPFEVWLDQSGKVKQITMGGIGKAVGNVTLTFSAGSNPMPFATPPLEQTVDISSIVNPSPGASPTPAETPGLDGDVS
jgi:hypothetical protein